MRIVFKDHTEIEDIGQDEAKQISDQLRNYESQSESNGSVIAFNGDTISLIISDFANILYIR